MADLLPQGNKSLGTANCPVSCRVLPIREALAMPLLLQPAVLHAFTKCSMNCVWSTEEIFRQGCCPYSSRHCLCMEQNRMMTLAKPSWPHSEREKIRAK